MRTICTIYMHRHEGQSFAMVSEVKYVSSCTILGILSRVVFVSQPMMGGGDNLASHYDESRASPGYWISLSIMHCMVDIEIRVSDERIPGALFDNKTLISQLLSLHSIERKKHRMPSYWRIEAILGI